MNKVFKVIWNHTTQSWVAVSELTSSKGKTKSKTVAKVTALSALVAGSVMGGQALAATSVSDGSGTVSIRIADITTAATATGANAIAAGNGSNAAGADSIAIGNFSSATGANTVVAGNSANARTSDAIAIGNSTLVSGPSGIAIGNNAAVIDPTEVNRTPVTNAIAIGTNANASGQGAIVIGHNAAAIQDGLNYANATGMIAIGTNTSANYRGAIALGENATTSWADSVAIGRDSIANVVGTSESGRRMGAPEASTAIGTEANASGIGAVALGASSMAVHTNTVALGHTAKALNSRDIAMGYNVTAQGAGSIAIGSESVMDGVTMRTSANTQGSIAIGPGATTTTATLDSNSPYAAYNGLYGIAIGRSARGGSMAATALGYNAQANGIYSSALGPSSTVVAKDSGDGLDLTWGAALGGGSCVTVTRGVALGNRAVADTHARTGFNPSAQQSTDSITISRNGSAGNDVVVTETFTATDTRLNTYKNLTGNALKATLAGVSVGSSTNTRQINHVAAGYADDDAVNVAQLRSVNLKIAGNTVANATPTAGVVSQADVLLDNQTLVVQSTNTTFLTTDATNNTINITVQNQVIPTTVSTNANGTGAGSIDVNATTDGVATTKNVAEAINSAYWKVGDNNATIQHNVSAGHQVNFVNGTGTISNVTAAGDNNFNNVSFNVNMDGTTITTNDDGQLTANVTSNITTNANGSLSVAGDNANQLVNASTLVNAINNASFSISTTAVDAFANQTTATANVSAGGNISYIAGKNIAIQQDGQNLTFSTTENVTFNNAVVNNTLTIGAGNATSPAINISSAVNNGTNQLNMGGAQLTNVTAGTETYGAGTNNVTNATTGLANLTASNDTNVITVADAKKLGWIVSATGNDYAANVTNANEVRFNGLNGLNVTGETVNGVRLINISIASGNVTANSTTGRAENGSTSVVTGDQVQNAINNSGWTTNLTNGTTLVVNPGDGVNYVNGNGTTANVTSANVSGRDVISVSYDVAQNGANLDTTNSTGRATLNDAANGTSTFLNAQDTVNLINNTSFNVNAGAVANSTGVSTYTANGDDAKVKAGDTVNFNAGNNIEISGSGKTFNIATKENVSFTNITMGNGTGATTITNGTITNLNDHITAPTNATSTVTNATATTVPANISNIGNQAATVNDVINSGWNLQANNQSVDAVTHGNNVNFISTDNSITITPTTDGTNSSLSFTVNATALATAASGNVSANSTTGRAVVGRNGVEDTTAGAAGRTATVGDVANTINNTGWLTNVTQVNATTGATETVTKVVTPGTQVNYVNGNGTTANTTLNSDGSVSVSYDIAQNTANLTATNSTGKATLGNATNGANTFLNAQDTVNLINNTSFNVNSTAVTGTNGQSTYTVNDESKVKAGDTVNLNAGQNIKIDGAGKTFNVSTTENATFTNMNVNSTLSIGGGNNTPVVNITTGTGNQTNGTTVTPTNTVDMGGSQLTNVSQGANVYGPNVDANGKPLTAVTIRNAAGQNEIRYYTADQFEPNGALKPGATDSTPVAANNVSNAMSGLADLASSNGSNAITVEDARNMGWVVSTSGNDYADKVQNANQVDFKAEANTGVTVKGATNATTGVREVVVGNDYAKTNSTGPAANAAGANSTAIGSNATSNVAGSIAIGQNANVANNAAPGSVAIGQGATAGRANQGDYRIDGSTNGIGGVPTENTRVFSVGNATSPAQIQHVAAGVVAANSTDAVNGSQLYATNQAITNNSQNINRLDNKVNRMNRDLRAGVAGANAAAGLPQVYIPGKSMVAASAGTFKGENALAVGYSRASDNGKVILKLQGNANSRGDVGGSVGVGYQW